jgi:hypothetical protein
VFVHGSNEVGGDFGVGGRVISLRHPDLPPDHCGFADRREETK